MTHLKGDAVIILITRVGSNTLIYYDFGIHVDLFLILYLISIIIVIILILMRNEYLDESKNTDVRFLTFQGV